MNILGNIVDIHPKDNKGKISVLQQYVKRYT
jgi:hypothetical protein